MTQSNAIQSTLENRVAKGMTEEYRIKEQKHVIGIKYLLPHIGVEPEKRAEKLLTWPGR